MTTGGVSDDRVAQARADLVDRFGYVPTEVTLVTVEPIVWPDAGLGCRNHERVYDPAPVPGYRIVLARGSLTFAYHGADGASPFLCQFLD